jgi:The ARF-like 2 binding protein BART
VSRNLDHFSFDEENKLIYTEIHHEYEEEIEKRIADGLPASFDMADFMSSLPAYLEGSGRDDETGATVTML